MTFDSVEGKRQRTQFERFIQWAESEGRDELPTHLDTLLGPDQSLRLKWLKERVQGEILEVGCSWGYVSAFVGARAGCDINPRLVKLAQLLAPQRSFRQGDARALPYEDLSFDTVMLPEILEHLPWEEVPIALEEANRVARHHILITTPDGATDSAEATNPKHRYLMTRERAARITKHLLALRFRTTFSSVGPFLCWEGRREQ